MHISADRKIPRNVAAILRTTSLLGEKFVELRPLGNPAKGPYLQDGDVITETQEAPELEFVAEQAINVLGAVTAGDVATLIDTGADVVHRPHRTTSARSSTRWRPTAPRWPTRTQNIASIVDHLDVSIGAVAGEGASLEGAPRRPRGHDARRSRTTATRRSPLVRNLSRLAAVQNVELDKYQANVEKQIHQVDDILRVLAGQTTELQSLIDWLDKFVYGVPSTIPNDFTNVFGWLIPSQLDPRVGTP